MPSISSSSLHAVKVNFSAVMLVKSVRALELKQCKCCAERFDVFLRLGQLFNSNIFVAVMFSISSRASHAVKVKFSAVMFVTSVRALHLENFKCCVERFDIL